MARVVLLLALLGCAGPAVVGQAPLTSGKTADIVAIPLRLSNVHLIRARQPVLIDSGTIGDMDDLGSALADYGVAATQVRLVVLTHGHADHAGLAAELQREAHAIVVLGAGDVPLAAAGHNDDLRPTGFMGALLKPFIRSVYEPFTPDVTVAPGDTFDLAPWGIDGKVMAMPGHTAGSLVVVLGDHTAFVGDMIAGGSLGGAFSPHTPEEHLYQADPPQNRKDIRALIDMGITKFYLGHGGPVSRQAVLEAFR